MKAVVLALTSSLQAQLEISWNHFPGGPVGWIQVCSYNAPYNPVHISAAGDYCTGIAVVSSAPTWPCALPGTRFALMFMSFDTFHVELPEGMTGYSNVTYLVVPDSSCFVMADAGYGTFRVDLDPNPLSALYTPELFFQVWHIYQDAGGWKFLGSAGLKVFYEP